ncbi:MAG TPA: transposase [Verrucomicrobiae bacterium]|nr:transposase [Verrucomicrobiae bacterium]
MSQENTNPRLTPVRFELRSAGVKDSYNPLRSGIHTRGYLPHVKREGASYFVTFRLADSLPPEVLCKIQRLRAENLARLPPEGASSDKICSAAFTAQAIEREYFRELEAYLDTGAGGCVLKRQDVAELVSNALRFFEGSRYLLRSWVVMPNHVHTVVWPMPNFTLSAITRSWKGYTAHEINKLLGRMGQPVWQPEAYDHWIRDDAEHERCCRYVIYNPVKARLCKTPEEWRWSSAWRGSKQRSPQP